MLNDDLKSMPSHISPGESWTMNIYIHAIVFHISLRACSFAHTCLTACTHASSLIEALNHSTLGRMIMKSKRHLLLRSLAPHCSLRSRALLRSFVRSLAH